MSTQAANNSDNLDFFSSQTAGEHTDAVNLDGLDHVFKWASETVSEGEDKRVKQARESRVRRQILDVVQQYKEQKVMAKSQDEVAYLQRRVIALLTRLQEMTEEVASVKQIMVTQYWTLQQIPVLEAQVKALKSAEYEKEAAVKDGRSSQNQSRKRLPGRHPCYCRRRKHKIVVHTKTNKRRSSSLAKPQVVAFLPPTKAINRTNHPD